MAIIGSIAARKKVMPREIVQIRNSRPHTEYPIGDEEYLEGNLEDELEKTTQEIPPNPETEASDEDDEESTETEESLEEERIPPKPPAEVTGESSLQEEVVPPISEADEIPKQPPDATKEGETIPQKPPEGEGQEKKTGINKTPLLTNKRDVADKAVAEGRDVYFTGPKSERQESDSKYKYTYYTEDKKEVAKQVEQPPGNKPSDVRITMYEQWKRVAPQVIDSIKKVTGIDPTSVNIEDEINRRAIKAISELFGGRYDTTHEEAAIARMIYSKIAADVYARSREARSMWNQAQKDFRSRIDKEEEYQRKKADEDEKNKRKRAEKEFDEAGKRVSKEKDEAKKEELAREKEERARKESNIRRYEEMIAKSGNPDDPDSVSDTAEYLEMYKKFIDQGYSPRDSYYHIVKINQQRNAAKRWMEAAYRRSDGTYDPESIKYRADALLEKGWTKDQVEKFTPKNAKKFLGSNVSSQKRLDSETAKSILKEAGGDKVRAREIARERGFVF